MTTNPFTAAHDLKSSLAKNGSPPIEIGNTDTSVTAVSVQVSPGEDNKVTSVPENDIRGPGEREGKGVN